MESQATARPVEGTRRVWTWGNAQFVSMAVGDSFEHRGRAVTLEAVEGDRGRVRCGGERAELRLARRGLPSVVGGVRVYLADTRPAARLATDEAFPDLRAATSRDAMLCLSDPDEPLLDPDRFVFPVSREDGLAWSMEENSHQFAYLRPGRSHEGVDMDLHGARGKERHPIVAIEDGRVVWVEPHDGEQAGVLIESASTPGLYYVHNHMNVERTFARPGDRVLRGARLGYIWGDNAWGHLHFSVVVPASEPEYSSRSNTALNVFPALYELWHGSLESRARGWSRGHWSFGRHRASNGNRKRIDAYSDIVGYGWRLGDWCPARKVEYSDFDIMGDRGRNARLRKTLFPGTAAACVNPGDRYTFEVAVRPGRYDVEALVGCARCASHQRVRFTDVDAGTYDLAAGRFAWTPHRAVDIADGRLTVELALRDAQTAAGISELRFERT